MLQRGQCVYLVWYSVLTAPLDLSGPLDQAYGLA